MQISHTFYEEIMGVSDTTLSIKYNVYSAKRTIGGVKFVQNFKKVADKEQGSSARKQEKRKP